MLVHLFIFTFLVQSRLAAVWRFRAGHDHWCILHRDSSHFFPSWAFLILLLLLLRGRQESLLRLFETLFHLLAPGHLLPVSLLGILQTLSKRAHLLFKCKLLLVLLLHGRSTRGGQLSGGNKRNASV